MRVTIPVTQPQTPRGAVASSPLEEEDQFYALIERLKILKLSGVARPRYEDGSELDPVLPSDLTILTDEQLGGLYTEFCAMAQWVGFQHSLAAAAKARLELSVKRTRSRVYLNQSGNREERGARTDVDPQVTAVEDELLLSQTLETLAFPILNSYLIGKESTSREMTRRMGTDWNRGGMGNSSIPRAQNAFGGSRGRRY